LNQISNKNPQRFQISPDAAANKMGDAVVLVHVGTDRIFELNSTAGRIWDLLSQGRDRAQILEQLKSEFPESDAVLAQQLDELLSSLIAEKFISVQE
jgi:hypothetical protein